jgi:hypothetical protein
MLNEAYLKPLESYQKTINFLSEKYRKDEQSLHKKLFELSKDKKDDDVELAIIPKLLIKINNTCKRPNVIIRKLEPHSENPFRFELQFISNYFNFVKVLSEFEKLDIVIHHIDIKPYEIAKTLPRHIIRIDIQAIQGAEELSDKVSNFLKNEIAKKNKRNPFQRFAKLGSNIERIIDLTWIHKLTSIGRINRKIYYVGDYFEDMQVIKIEPSKVSFSKKNQNGLTRFIIGFRNLKQNDNENRKNQNNNTNDFRDNLPQGIRNEIRF